MIRAPNSSDKNENSSWLVKTAMLCAARASSSAAAQLAAFALRSPSSSFVAGWLVTYCNTCNTEESSDLPRCCARLRAAAAAGRALPPTPPPPPPPTPREFRWTVAFFGPQPVR
jgi:hypothetical protein